MKFMAPNLTLVEPSGMPIHKSTQISAFSGLIL